MLRLYCMLYLPGLTIQTKSYLRYVLEVSTPIIVSVIIFFQVSDRYFSAIIDSFVEARGR